ncbi:MAG: glycosyltransferase family 2 protein [Bacteroidota bacterium]|nr:glycosyltransferase family 2 protein [Bacteroidota bacterium]
MKTETTGQPLVSIITVNYNTAEVTLQLLQSLQVITYTNVEIIVVDNASAQDASCIQKEYPHIIFIQNKTNEGFAGGNNRGIKIAKGEIIFLLNNDTEVDSSFIEPIVNLFKEDSTIGIVSSKLIYYHSDKTIQYAGGTGINPFTARGKFIGCGEKDNGQYNQPAKTHLAHGAAMAIHRKVFDKIGLLPEMYFLYYEELDFSEHAQRAGFAIWCQPKSVVFHKESMSVGKMSSLKVYYQNRNRLLFIRRNIFGMKGLISRLFFITISVPAGIIKYSLRGKWNLAFKIWQGLLWNFKY